MKVAKKDGSKVELDEGKLWDSLYYPAREVDYGKERAVEIADRAKHQVMEFIHEHEDNVVTTTEIAEKAQEALEDVDEHVRIMYEKHLDIN
ncbi:MAG: ATP cone domain-containing protein [Candidatus Nanosalina sp.]